MPPRGSARNVVGPARWRSWRRWCGGGAGGGSVWWRRPVRTVCNYATAGWIRQGKTIFHLRKETAFNVVSKNIGLNIGNDFLCSL